MKLGVTVNVKLQMAGVAVETVRGSGDMPLKNGGLTLKVTALS